jgi:hypothetical protein
MRLNFLVVGFASLLTIINLIAVAANVATSARATVAGLNSSALKMDSDFRSAVFGIVQGYCTAKDLKISCPSS